MNERLGMKERPILFSAPMVRAILDGRKTQTRRVVREDWQHFKNVVPLPECAQTDRGEKVDFPGRDGGSFLFHNGIPILDLEWQPVGCPYGQPGDRLWMREAWRIGAWDEEEGRIAVDYRADGYCRREWLTVPDGDMFNRYWQQSTDDAIKAYGHQDRYAWEPGQSPCRWRQARFMPRFASRILLEITGVRVERLQDIREADAIAEGIELVGGPASCEPWRNYRLGSQGEMNRHCSSPIRSYLSLWESINGPGSWDTNPWVWVIEFRPLQPMPADTTLPAT